MARDFGLIALAYIIALVAAFFALQALPYSVLVNALIADLIATCVVFAFSRTFKNSSFYDAYWSVFPPFIAIYWLMFHMGGASDIFHTAEAPNTTRAYIVTALIVWWAIRLTLNWASHWGGLSHEDWRYQPIRDKAGKFEFIADFFSTHLIPTLIVLACLLPVHAAVNLGNNPMGWLDWMALFVTASAILIETIADLQLHKFNASKAPGTFIKTGLWRLSRHPNYFGEWGFWFGLMLFGIAAHPEGWLWIIPGVIVMFALIRFASVPMMDQRSTERRTGYDQHMKTTSAFFPWFPKKP